MSVSMRKKSQTSIWWLTDFPSRPISCQAVCFKLCIKGDVSLSCLQYYKASRQTKAPRREGKWIRSSKNWSPASFLTLKDIDKLLQVAYFAFYILQRHVQHFTQFQFPAPRVPPHWYSIKTLNCETVCHHTFCYKTGLRLHNHISVKRHISCQCKHYWSTWDYSLHKRIRIRKGFIAKWVSNSLMIVFCK